LGGGFVGGAVEADGHEPAMPWSQSFQTGS
jgi:hypothetical protein